MIKLWIDDIRPAPTQYLWFMRTNDVIGYMRRMYKQGCSEFYLDLDHDAGDFAQDGGGDYINILKALEDMRNCGKMTHLNLTCHFHSMNPVGVQNMRAIIEANSSWIKED